ncbi:MAG: amidohydrolase family protein [Pseudomonadota bacterium]
MKFAILFAGLLAAISLARADTTAFVNVNVVTMTSETVLTGQTVIIRDGLIETLGPVDATPVPDGTVIIDGTDRFLMPGLTEMHAHIAPVDAASFQRTLDLFVVNGVTTVRGMLGHPSHLALRDQLLSGAVFGPRLITSGPSLNGNSVSGAADAAAKVRAQADAGYDFLKLHPGLTLDEFNAIDAAADEHGLTYAGHISVAVGLRRSLDAGMATVDHLDGYLVAMLPNDHHGAGGFGGFFDVLLAMDIDESLIDTVVDATVRAGTWNVPTQLLIENVISTRPAEELGRLPEMRYMPAAVVDSWIATKKQVMASGMDPKIARRAIEVRRKLLLALHRSSGRLLLGSDAPQVFNVPGFSSHRELALLVEAGLSPFDALSTGTIRAAEFLELPIGRIEPGAAADLVLVDDNPLNDIANSQRVHGVMLRGRWISPEERRAILDRYRREDDA